VPFVENEVTFGKFFSLGLPELCIPSRATERILITCNIGIYSKNFSGEYNTLSLWGNELIDLR
jgi:hypothetical protein